MNGVTYKYHSIFNMHFLRTRSLRCKNNALRLHFSVIDATDLKSSDCEPQTTLHFFINDSIVPSLLCKHSCAWPTLEVHAYGFHDEENFNCPNNLTSDDPLCREYTNKNQSKKLNFEVVAQAVWFEQGLYMISCSSHTS